MTRFDSRRFRRILDAARAGEQQAWTELYRAHAAAILGYARARGAIEPEDVLGDTFEHAVRSIEQFSGGERDFRAWLLGIAHNRLVDAVRHEQRRPQTASPAGDPDIAAQADAGRELGDVEQEALEELGAQEVRELLKVLSSDQEAVFLLRVLGDLSTRQVARVLGKRTGAVRALQHRAAAALERELRRRGVEGPEGTRRRP